MTKQYSIGGFFIDLSRNQITQNKQSQTLAPKALAVLTYLAENQGQVVSHDALLNQVWPKTVVSPNTLQRSIAQLRKALGDDGRVQVYIKTHAKQGYSLECDVRWHDSVDLTSSNHVQNGSTTNTFTNESTKQRDQSKFRHGLVLALVGLIVLGITGYYYFLPEQNTPYSFDTLRSITATDDKEFDASYSPDGQYIVFHRYLDKQCNNKIWAKNIDTQEEIQLTKDWGAYGRHSFSEDGKKLVFLATEACREPVTQRNCYDLVSLDFENALASPQQPDLVLQCQNSDVKKPIWFNNNDIALLQKHSDRWKLISYSITEDKSNDIYNLKDGNIIDYTYSVKDDLIAVTSIHNDGQHYIEMLKPDSSILSSHPIQYPQEIPQSQLIFPNFDPVNEQLIFSTGRQLFTLSYEGKVDKISLPFTDKMVLPEFHPNGKKILFIKGPYDSDIVLQPLNEISDNRFAETNQAQPEQVRPYTSFERSNLGENHAIFQPGGELIAFWSERSGDEQLWISDGTTAQQITQFPVDTYIRGIDWAADGQSLLVNANNVLTQVFLDSRQRTFPLNDPVTILFQWDSENNSALLLLRVNGILKLVEHDFNHSKTTEITDKKVLWALKSEDGQLIYKDYLGQFWRPGPVEDQMITSLANQSGKAKSFIINGNLIYAINNENLVWSYNLSNDTYKTLGEVSEDVDYLTDINQTQLLMTRKVSAKKEVVELSLSQ